MRKLLCAVILALAIQSVPAIADDLTDRSIAALQAALPDSTITVTDPRTLKVRARGIEFSVALDNIGRVCAGDPADCSHALEVFAHKIAVTMTVRDPVHTSAQLRAVVRDKAYFDNLSDLMKRGRTPTTMVFKPIVGDLIEICYFDHAEGLSPATEGDIVKLGLDRVHALALCEKNVHAVLPALASAANIPAKEFSVLGGDAYSSSYFAFHDDWAPVAARFHGSLLVSVPESDVVIFAEEKDSQTALMLSRAAANGMKTAQRPVSASVYRWTRTGWEIASP